MCIHYLKKRTNPQAFNKVSEGETSKLSSLIRQSIDLNTEIDLAENILKIYNKEKELLMRKTFHH